jgi:hypothetical protein
LPRWTALWVRSAALTLAVHLGGSALLLAVALGAAHERVLKVHEALDPGVVGGFVLTAIQLALVPDAVIWVAAFAAGPGFAIGTGTSVASAGVVLGPLPALPLLGGLPEPGALPSWAVLLVALPVLAGAAAGVLIVRRARPLLLQLADVVVTALLTGLVFAGLAWAAGGAAGPGRLGEIGPDPVEAGLALLVEAGGGAAVVVLLTALAEAVRGLTGTHRAGHANA